MSMRTEMERIAALEQEVARLDALLSTRSHPTSPRISSYGVLFLVAGMVLCAAGADQATKQAVVPGPTPVPPRGGEIADFVRARRFAVVDESGRERVVIQTKKEHSGTGAVVVKNGSGRVLAAIGEDGQGQGRVQLYDSANGIIRAEMLIQKDGAAGLMLRDRDATRSKGRTRATVWLRPDGTPELTLRDVDSNVRVASVVLPNGNALSMLRDTSGTSKVILSVDADGTGGVRLFDGPDQYRAGMTILPDGSPGLTLLNEQGNGGIQMTMEAKGKRGGIILRDHNGRDRARMTLTNEGPAVIESLSKTGSVNGIWPPNPGRD